MLNTVHETRAAPRQIDEDGQLQWFTHCDEVLRNKTLSISRKREILAGWASDAHAVADLPAMRQLDSGAIVSVDAVLTALRALDAQNHSVEPKPSGTWFRRNKRLRFFLDRGRRSDDDDDPPPCPAAALPPGFELELRRCRDAEWKLAPTA